MIFFNLISVLTILLYVSEPYFCAESACPNPYSKCNLGKDGFTNVHIVSHTHDDVGWLKTVDQYYYGSNNGEAEDTVQYILDTVILELLKDPNKRFVYVEIAYFWRWWNEQNDPMKQSVRMLVNEHRLEFVIGAWCMNDEATAYYTDIIDQQTLGFKFILKEFGPCARPRLAWQIDPFGHSREQASLFAQFGFDGLFLGRIDYQDFENRGVLQEEYSPPQGFCWDGGDDCGDDGIMDDIRLDEYNVDKKVEEFLAYTKFQASQYKTTNLIMTMGNDFVYSNAHRWFKNLDKLIHYVNKQQETNSSKVNIFYSTPACYLYALNHANTTWNTKYDDFFPYADNAHQFWTGFYTSRAALKYNVRRTGNYLQSARHLAALSNLNDNSTSDSIIALERAMAVVQHHDGVSGTEKQHVAYDYAKRLWNGQERTLKVVENSLNEILKINFNITNKSSITYCSLLNITECLPIENSDNFTAIIYNPLPRSVESWIELPIVFPGYQVFDLQNGKEVVSDVALVYPEIALIMERKSKAGYRLVFKAELPPMGFKTYFIKKQIHTPLKKIISPKKHYAQSENGGFELHNSYIGLDFDSFGNLIQIRNFNQSRNASLAQSFCFYKSMPGDNENPDHQASGAYIFRPLNNTPECLSVKEYKIFSGNQFGEVHQIFNDWISQTIRVYEGAQHAEFEWQVGPIDIEDNYGKEVIMRFQSNLNSASFFYTDSNGREIMERELDFRPTWNLNQTEPVAGNYLPINSFLIIRDEALNKKSEKKQVNDYLRQITLINDRSQGGSSLSEGGLELMLHRRTLFDDDLGVDEPLNETVFNKQGLVIKGVVFMVFGVIDSSYRIHRPLAHRINNRPLITFSNEVSAKENFKYLSGWSAFGGSPGLPENLHLLTFSKEFQDNNLGLNSVLVRIEHFYEKGEDDFLSQPVTVNLRDVFKASFNFIGVEELALGANMPVDELNERLKWNPSSNRHFGRKIDISKSKAIKSDDFNFTFNPMQIRTFRLYF